MRSIQTFRTTSKCVRFACGTEPFSIENGMLTANGKLKRDLIATRMKNEIEDMYRVKQAV